MAGDYRVPTIDDDPDVPLWMGRLADDVAADVTLLEDTLGEVAEQLPASTGSDVVAWSITDDQKRRSWLEINPAGHPTDHAAGLIADAVTDLVAEDLPLPQEINEGPGYAYVITDLQKRIAFAVDFAGKVVVGGGSSTPAPAADPTAIILPAAISMVVGMTYRLNYADFVAGLSRDHTVVISDGAQGTSYADYWQITPAAAGTFNLVVTVYDRAGAIVRTYTSAVTKYAAPAGASLRHMAIGDSITRAGNYAGTAVAAFAGAKTVGTRTYNGGALCVEGRGGWTLDNYMVRIGNVTGDSPFLFPVGVAGAKFLGNTTFWKKVCYEDTAGYDFAGFQQIARGWLPAGNPYLYDASGYPTAPTEGDVVIDPAQAAGSQWRKYTAGAWAVMSPQPAVEFNFSKYMERYAAAYPTGGPTSISLMLQTNDFFSGSDQAKVDAWLGKLNTVIASIRAWSATVPFTVLLAAAGGPIQNWGTQTQSKYMFDRAMQDSAQRILAAVQTTAMANNKVRVATFLGAVSPANMSDHVHPTVPAGHDQMAPWLAGPLAKQLTEG